MINKSEILKRIGELKSVSINAVSRQTAEEIYSGTLNLVNLLYGSTSQQLKYLSDLRRNILDSTISEMVKLDFLCKSLIGFLTNLEKEINSDFIQSLEKDISGELFADINIMSKNAIEGGFKDVAAVLSAAALEDSLKKLAKFNSLDVENKDMSEVINALKSQSIISGAQIKILQGFVNLRNKAFHAEWDKIDSPEIKSLISFNEEFILRHFSR